MRPARAARRLARRQRVSRDARAGGASKAMRRSRLGRERRSAHALESGRLCTYSEAATHRWSCASGYLCATSMRRERMACAQRATFDADMRRRHNFSMRRCDLRNRHLPVLVMPAIVAFSRHCMEPWRLHATGPNLAGVQRSRACLCGGAWRSHADAVMCSG